jgi:transposase
MTTRSKVRFKEITSQQSVLFPSNISNKIAANHPVRIVNQIVDRLNIEDVLIGYKGGGTSSYHPRMMIKILFYSYFCNVYSSRKIAKLLHENIYFMWLSGKNTPNFRTINDFRGKRLKHKIQSLFSELVLLMADLGYISLDVQYIDGTKK